MTKTQEILITILAHTDAVWLPQRLWVAPRPSNTSTARMLYAAGGVPWSGDADRETARTLEKLEGEALTRHRPRGTKTTLVKLSDLGEVQARHWAGFPPTADTRRALEKLSPRWQGEDVLAGLAWGAAGQLEAFNGLAEMLLPWLIRGIAESGSDLAGRVRYRRLAPPGATAWPKPTGTRSVAACVKLYCAARDDVWLRLGTAEPKNPQCIGELRLPVSMDDGGRDDE